jgi:NAD(P)H-flavin reductase
VIGQPADHGAGRDSPCGGELLEPGQAREIPVRGDVLDVTAPYGDFVLRESPAPMLSLLRGALQSLRQPREVTLVFGARRRQDLYMLDAIDALRREWPVRFDFVPVLVDEPVGSTWTGRRGLIGDHLVDVPGESVSDQQTYLCGPPGMIDSCTGVLRHAGAGQAGIYFDKFLDQSHLALAGKAA